MKRIKESRATRKARTEWARQWSRCWACGAGGSWLPLAVHHLLSGPCRSDEICCWTISCAECHDRTHGGTVRKNGVVLPKITLSNWLWLKAYHDPDGYDLPLLRELKGEFIPAPEAPAQWYGNGVLVDRVEVVR